MASSGSVRIAGASTVVAPSSRRRPASALAWARARVTATVRPSSGRAAASQPSESPSAATSPMTVIAGALISCAAAASASVSTVAITWRWPGSVPRSITAAGSAAGRPSSISFAVIFGRLFTPM